MLNSNGPSTVPCGIPYFTVHGSLVSPLILVVWDLFERYDLNHSHKALLPNTVKKREEFQINIIAMKG